MKLLPGYSLWSKDLIFVVSDGYLEGMQAWITAYHEAPQSSDFLLLTELSVFSFPTAVQILLRNR